METIRAFIVFIFWPLFLFFFFLFAIVFSSIDLVYALSFWSNPQLPITILAWHLMLVFNMFSVFLLAACSFFYMIGGKELFRLLGKEIERYSK